MVVMKVEIYEKGYVRPNTPTPHSLRNYKLSLSDQIFGTMYTPVVFFYGGGSGESNYCPHDYDELKKSLSKTLSVLYPLAGRIRDGLTVECNYEGAEFAVAEVRGCDLGDILRHPKLELLWQLLPRDPQPTAFDPAQPMLAVQVNRFRCSGTALAVCIWHAVADASAIVGFFRTWAAINRGDEEADGSGSIADPTSTAAIFPPANFNLSEMIISNRYAATIGKHEYCTKRFFFSVEKIEQLRNQYNNSGEGLTRVEALLSFVWAAVIRATLKPYPNLKKYVFNTLVNLREKLNPPFPSTCQGNILHITETQWDNEVNGVGVEAGSLVGRVREAIRKVTDDYIKKTYANGDYLKAFMASIEQGASSDDNIKFIDTSSICKFPFLEVDFGWGRPLWMGMPQDKSNNTAIFIDTADGGVELWIWLPPLVMRNLDKDEEFLAYVSFSQSLKELSNLSARL